MTIVGFIGLGAMGLPMAKNIHKKLCQQEQDAHESEASTKKDQHHRMYVYDVNTESVQSFLESCNHPKEEGEQQDGEQQEGTGTTISVTVLEASSPREIGEYCDVIITMLPNDAILKQVVTCQEIGLLAGIGKSVSSSSTETKTEVAKIHISCSTVHPDTSRELSKLHLSQDQQSYYIGAPIFARADGVAQRAASFVVGCENSVALEQAMPWLDAMAMSIYKFGDNKDAGAGNVVKLCGNYMIATAIESCAEACSLAENNGLDRVDVMDMLTSTIFDCLIYKGYGMRTAHRQHIPGQPMVGQGFQLSLGLKDISLTKDVADKTKTPMPFLSTLQNRFITSENQGRGQMDWSALGLLASEEAGVDVSAWLPGGGKAVDAGDSIAPV